MTEKQIMNEGLTTNGWKKIDELLARANKQQLRYVIIKCIKKLPEDVYSITYNSGDKN